MNDDQTREATPIENVDPTVDKPGARPVAAEREPNADDTEGHGWRWPSIPEDDTEAHSYRWPAMPEEKTGSD